MAQEMTNLPSNPSPTGPGFSTQPKGIFVSSQLLKDARTSMVQVFWRGKEKTEETPGFAVSNGMFVSVRKGATVMQEVVLRNGDKDYEGRVVLVDTKSGVVLLEGVQSEVDSIPPLALGTSRSFYVGDALFAVTLDDTGRADRCLVGLMVGRDRRLEGTRLPIGLLRAQIPECEPIGGLPIMEGSGKVIAIDLGRELEDDGEFHALPIEVVAKLVTDLENFGKREDAWLGVTFNRGTTTPKVVSVRPNSPGDRAGLLPGDIVINFAGARIDTLDDLSDTCYCLTPGRETEIHILRGITSVKRKLQPMAVSSKPQDGGVPRP